MKKWIITFFLLMLAVPAWSADKQFNAYTNGTTITDADELIFWKTVEGDVYNIAWSAFITELNADLQLDETYHPLWDYDYGDLINKPTIVDWSTDQETNIHAGNIPTLNQSTSGSAATLSISGQSGLLSVTGLASTNRIKTVRDAADTILELGGSYTPTGTWNWTSVTWSNVPTLNQNTTGTAAGLTAQYIDWNSASGGDSIANKPTIIDWTSDQGSTNVHAGNIPDLSGTYPVIASIPYLVGADIALDATGDTSPPVTANRKHVVTATAGVVIASLTDADGDYSDFENGDRVVHLCQDKEVGYDFTSNTEFGYGGGVDFTCSDTIPTVIEFEFDTVNTRWNVISGLPYGYSDPTTLALAKIEDQAPLIGDPDSWTPDASDYYGGRLIADAAGEMTLETFVQGMYMVIGAEDEIEAIYNPASGQTFRRNGVLAALNEALITDDTADAFSRCVLKWYETNIIEASCTAGMDEETPE